MSPVISILAARDEDPLMKIIFFVIFALIWGVGALAKMASKKKEQEHRERVRAELEASRANAPDYDEIASRPSPPAAPVPRVSTSTGYQPPTPPPPQRVPAPYHPPAPPPPVPPRMNIPANRPSPVSINRGNQRQKQQKQKKPKKPAQVFAERPFPEAAASPTPVTAPPAVARQPGPAVDAGQLRGWLRPQTLREQFMLTEILQRPLALRPDRD